MSVPSSSFPKSSPMMDHLSTSMAEDPEIPTLYPIIVTASPNPDLAPPTTAHPLIVHYIFTDDPPPPPPSTSANTHTIAVHFESVEMEKITEARSFSKDWQVTNVRSRRVQGIEGGDEGVMLEIEGLGKEAVVRTSAANDGKELYEKIDAASLRWAQLARVVGFDGEVRQEQEQQPQQPHQPNHPQQSQQSQQQQQQQQLEQYS